MGGGSSHLDRYSSVVPMQNLPLQNSRTHKMAKKGKQGNLKAQSRMLIPDLTREQGKEVKIEQYLTQYANQDNQYSFSPSPPPPVLQSNLQSAALRFQNAPLA